MGKILLSTALLLLLFIPRDIFGGGHLVIIGGGPRPDYIMEKFIELAGGKDARIIIFPTASSDPVDAGEFYVNEFIGRGVNDVDYIICTQETADTKENFAKLSGATGVFFSGGDQNRHTAALLGTQLLENVREIYRNGGVIGGTSAGAAVMSQVMITGDEDLAEEDDEPFSIIKEGNIITAEGFGFLDNVIIDQHFVRRKRHNRLISLVLEYPHLVGIGIDESTAVIKKPNGSFDVMGEYTVIVYDAREANNISVDENGNIVGRNLSIHILKHGDKYKLDQNS